MNHLVIPGVYEGWYCQGWGDQSGGCSKYWPVTEGWAPAHAHTHAHTFSVPLITTVSIKGALHVQSRKSTHDSGPYDICACKWTHSHVIAVHRKYISLILDRIWGYLTNAWKIQHAHTFTFSGNLIWHWDTHTHTERHRSRRLTANCISFSVISLWAY